MAPKRHSTVTTLKAARSGSPTPACWANQLDTPCVKTKTLTLGRTGSDGKRAPTKTKVIAMVECETADARKMP